MSSITLRNSSIVPATFTRYTNAAQQFLTFLKQQHITIHTEQQLDSILASYIEYLYHNHHSYSLASYTFNGLIFFCPRYKTHLPVSHSQLTGWHRRHPTVSKPPLTVNLVKLISAVMLTSGDTDCAVATILAFDCYLRISEFTRLAVSDVSSPLDTTFANQTAIRLARTKTGTNQSVIVLNTHVVAILHAYIARRIVVVGTGSGAASLFGVSADQYRRVFHRVCDVLQLSSLNFTPHSLRHGAATRDYLARMPIDDIMFRGRWASTKSTRIYVQSSRALLIQLDIPRYAAELADTLSAFTLTQLFMHYIVRT
jgi:integrase